MQREEALGTGIGASGNHLTSRALSGQAYYRWSSQHDRRPHSHPSPCMCSLEEGCREGIYLHPNKAWRLQDVGSPEEVAEPGTQPGKDSARRGRAGHVRVL